MLAIELLNIMDENEYNIPENETLYSSKAMPRQVKEDKLSLNIFYMCPVGFACYKVQIENDKCTNNGLSNSSKSKT